MIFAAGLGTRFKPWTDTHPKALAVVNGKSLLQRNIENLQTYGIRDVVVNVHHFPEQIITAVEENQGWGSNVVISDETGEVLETGGGLVKARRLLEGEEPFLTVNVDILTDLNLKRFVDFHRDYKPLISLAVTHRSTSRYFLFDEFDRLCGWKNRKTDEERIALKRPDLVDMAYSGIAIFESRVFDLISKTGKFSLVDVYLELAADHMILGYDHSGDKWVDVGRVESVEKAEQAFE